MQLVGRILRVHRRLQGRSRQPSTLPEPLRYGYVFLADPEAQTAVDLAGQRINQIQTEYAKVSPTTIAVRVGGQPPMVQLAGAGGQLGLFQTPPTTPDEAEAESAADEFTTGANFDFGKFFGESVNVSGDADAETKRVPGTLATYRYALRAGMPRRFKTVVSAPNEVTEEDCANRFLISTRELFDALKSRIKVERKTLDVFTGQLALDFVGAALEPRRAAWLAQEALKKAGDFDARELRFALLRKAEAVMREEFMDEADDPEKVKHLLDVLLTVHPELLAAAQRATRATTAMLADADDPPPEMESAEALPHSPRNVYGVLPADLNSWERGFVQVLEHDANAVVQWWHRNLPGKDWSVKIAPKRRGFTTFAKCNSPITAPRRFRFLKACAWKPSSARRCFGLLERRFGTRRSSTSRILRPSREAARFPMSSQNCSRRAWRMECRRGISATCVAASRGSPMPLAGK